jgi:hypothetical protein
VNILTDILFPPSDNPQKQRPHRLADPFAVKSRSPRIREWYDRRYRMSISKVDCVVVSPMRDCAVETLAGGGIDGGADRGLSPIV